MIIRWHLRTTLFALCLFALTVVLIRVQPYDELARKRAFVSDGCTGACFIGIQPGVTSVDEAVRLLQASDWVGAVDNRTINNVSGFISWTWSDRKPSWISASKEGKIWATQKQVVNINIYSDWQLGDTRIILGAPDQELIDRSIDRKGILSLFSSFYAQTGLIIESWQPCNVLEPLRRQVIVTYTLKASPDLFPERDSLRDLRHTCAIPRS